MLSAAIIHLNKEKVNDTLNQDLLLGQLQFHFSPQELYRVNWFNNVDYKLKKIHRGNILYVRISDVVSAYILFFGISKVVLLSVMCDKSIYHV